MIIAYIWYVNLNNWHHGQILGNLENLIESLNSKDYPEKKANIQISIFSYVSQRWDNRTIFSYAKTTTTNK